MYILKGMVAAVVLSLATQTLYAADEDAPPTPSESPSTGTGSAQPVTVPPTPETPANDDKEDKDGGDSSGGSDPDCE